MMYSVFNQALLKQGWANPYEFAQHLTAMTDPFGIARATLQVQQSWISHPQWLSYHLLKLNADAWTVQWRAWERYCGVPREDDESSDTDARFQDPAWEETPYLAVIKDYYVLLTRWLEDAISETPDTDEKTQERAAFWMHQMLDAAAPSNFFWLNPIAVRQFFESNGESVVRGLKNLLADTRAKTIRMTDTEAFSVGDNLANTPGQVVYRSPLFELIQYTPQTEQVHSTPILFVPPWINKYYILDLNERKSLVNHMVKQGFSVFLISWKNPDSSLRDTSWEDYMFKGVLEAAQVAKDIAQVPQLHAAGYCIGGTLLTTVMAWLNADGAKEQDNPFSSWTNLTTLVEFSNPGEITTFLDETSLRFIDEIMAQKGYLEGQSMADSFRMLRANTLIWHYYVHNYLYGEELPKFDVLYWNMDSTRLPEKMHSFYLREFYLNNKLAQAGAFTFGERKIDLGQISQPLYDVSTLQDHIAPWTQTFKKMALLNSPVRHVLASSGHIMGIVSPPVEPPKRHYWVGDATNATDAQAWLDGQEQISGSWWEDWAQWLAEQCGDQQAPPSMGNAQYPALESAPGSYVLEH